MPFVQLSLLGTSPTPDDMPTSETSERTTSSASTSSQVDFRASLARQRDTALDVLMRDGFGRSSLASSLSFDRATSSWRTSQDSLPSTTGAHSEKFSEIWPRSGTMRGGIVSELPMSVRLNGASGYGSSDGWPTPVSTDSANAARHTTTTGLSHPGTSLTDAIRSWPTPTGRISNDGEGIESWERRAASLKEKHYNGNGAGVPLTIAIQKWPTPTAHDGAHGPRGAKSSENRNPEPSDLSNAVAWPTPTARDWKSGSAKRDFGNARPLSEQIHWATPTAAEATRGPGHSGRDGAPNLTTQSSQIRKGSLNPDWVETLMGAPMGWTTIPAALVSALKSTLAALGLRAVPIRGGTQRRRARRSTRGNPPGPPSNGGSDELD